MLKLSLSIPSPVKWGQEECLSQGDLEKNVQAEGVASTNLRSGQGPDLFACVLEIGNMEGRG